MPQRTAGPAIHFDTTVFTIGGSTLLRLPDKASAKLPSRGQVVVKGVIEGHTFQTVLEPDGRSGHWMKVDDKLQRATGIGAGDVATLDLELAEDWPEPQVPEDLASALAIAPHRIQELWKDITPMARWEWVRWVDATNNPDTRERRVEVTISKMNGGKRRPCCFNLASCTDPQLARNGKLLDPRE
jgi:Domain of unknown function (DUF1905)/Bacteriocin-protection, YdeI or OmpD-Associated